MFSFQFLRCQDIRNSKIVLGFLFVSFQYVKPGHFREKIRPPPMIGALDRERECGPGFPHTPEPRDMMFIQQGMFSPSTFDQLKDSSGRAIFSSLQEVFDEF
jgi:hypothetical protein